MSEFTPGPWNACHDGECKCGFVFGNKGSVFVAQVYGPYHQSDGIAGPDTVPLREQQKANAKLIAAAPLMHEALAVPDETLLLRIIEILEGIDRNAHLYDLIKEIQNKYELERAALAARD